MKLLKSTIKRIILVIVMLSLLITFMATPASYAKLDLKEGDFYYSGTTEGRYAPSQNIFSWLLGKIGDIADWLVGIITFGFRMIFVGWTALFEKILTWSLEYTTGVSTDGSLVGSSTDLTNVSDSSGNVTVEAIVYNRVPALNADIFDLDFDRTRSGTGKKMICEDCEQPVEECKKGATTENITKDSTVDEIACSGVKVDPDAPEGTTGEACNCNGCGSCTKYIAQLSAKEPLIIQLRKLVATWYQIIQLLCVAAMLVVLIAVGIKMAISTIASDKAVYKRMLVDWVVGMIMIFALHYFMIFVIHMTNVLVDVVEQSAQSINKVSLTQISGEETVEISNEEIELSVYEELRTRAYDAKLTNGLIGMVMYMTLVFFAYKYVIIYLKRLFTIIVLTLMSPAVGVSYALQKVLSGKSSTLKTWMTEYIMNMIIQVVHALMYAIFISQAMVLSLQNVTGMLFALILINYTSKADALFKKVFKFGGGDSLVGHTEGALESSMQSLQNAKGMIMGAKPLAKALTNTPYGKAVKGLGKLAVGAGVGAIGGIANAIDNATWTKKAARDAVADYEYESQLPTLDIPENASTEDKEKAIDQHGEALEAAIAGIRNGGAYKKETVKEDNKEKEIATAEVENQDLLDRALLDTDPKKLEEELKKAQDEFRKVEGKDKNDPDFVNKQRNLQRAFNNSRRYAKLTKATQGKIALGHAQKAFEIRNEFKLRHSLGNTKPTKGESFKAAIGQGIKGTFGTMHFDNRNWKFTRDDKNAAYKRFNAENLLGFTPDDKKMFKQHVLTPMAQGFIGMGSLFFGMATVVANPKMGMALLATGAGYTSKTFRKPTGVKSSGNYTFSRYGTLSMNAIKNSAIQQARRERRGLTAEHLGKTRPGFVQNLKDGKLVAVTLGIAFAPITVPANAIMHPINTTSNVVNFAKNSTTSVVNTLSKMKEQSIKENLQDVGHAGKNVLKGVVKYPGKVVENYADNLKYRVDHFGEGVQDAATFLNDQTFGRFVARTAMADHLEAIDNHSMIQQRKQEAEFKEEAVKMMNVQASAEFDYLQNKLKEEQEKEQVQREIEIYKSLGYHYNPKTGAITQIKGEDSDRRIPEPNDIGKDEFRTDTGIDVTQDDINTINKEIDYVIMQLSKNGYIDMNYQGVQDRAIQMLEDKFASNAALKGKGIDEIFKHGKSGLKQTLKLKAANANSKTESAKAALIEPIVDKNDKTKKDTKLQECQADILTAVSELMASNLEKGKKPSEIKPKDVVARVNANRKKDGSSSVSESDGSRKVVEELKLEGTHLQKVSEYINAVTATSTSELSQQQVRREAKRLEKARNEKLQQVLAISMDVDLDDTVGKHSRVTDKATSESVVEQLLTQKGAQNVAGINLSATEAETASVMLKKLLEIKSINQVAVKDLDMKKGTSGYKKAKTKKNQLAMEIETLQKDLKEFPKDSADYKKTERKLESKEIESAANSNRLSSYTTGPVADINELLKNGIGRR